MRETGLGWPRHAQPPAAHEPIPLPSRGGGHWCGFPGCFLPVEPVTTWQHTPRHAAPEATERGVHSEPVGGD